MRWRLLLATWFICYPLASFGEVKPVAVTPVPELEPLQSKYNAKVNREVFEPHEKAIANLIANYLVEATRALTAAEQGKKLDEIVALKAEKEQAETGHGPPPVDDPTEPKRVKALRTTFRAELGRLLQERDRKWQPLCDEYSKSLEALLASLTRQGKIEEALAVKTLMERLKSPGQKIVGQWDIEHCNNAKSVWRFNKDNTYNYWNETGKFTYKNGHYQLHHTWDWDLKMVDDDTFEGFCTRGKSGCLIKGKRITK